MVVAGASRAGVRRLSPKPMIDGMIRSILAAAILSLGVVSVALTFTPSPATSPQVVARSDVLQVKHNKSYKGGEWHNGKWHGNKHNYNVHGYKSAPMAGVTIIIVRIAGRIAAAS